VLEPDVLKPAARVAVEKPAAAAQPLSPVVTVAPLVEIEAPAPVIEPVENRELIYKWRRMRREIFIPFEGELGAVKHYRVASPAGVAIELSTQATVAGPERYFVRRPGVSRVDIARNEYGTRIRILVHQPFDSYRVQAVRGGLRFTLPGPFQAD